MRVGLLTQWYDPEPGPAALPGVLARGLLARGHEVQVLTGFPNYPSGQIADGYRISRRQDEVLDGADIRRVALYPSHDAAMSGRLLNYGTFGASALVSGASALRDVDVLWVNYSPITVAPAMWWLHYARRVPVVMHVLDLWPDTLVASGFADGGAASRAVTRAAETWCRGMYASAASVIVNSPGVESVLSRRGVDPARINYVPMWANEDVARPADDAMRASLGVSADSIALLYAGALGGAQGLEVLLEACARVEDPRFVCLIAGSGVSEGSLRARADELGLTNVRFLGRIPQGDMADLMGAADAAFISLNDDPLAAITMPSKFQATLAAGRAIVASATGDLAEAVRESGAGFVSASGDVDGLAAHLRSLPQLGRTELAARGRVARDVYTSRYSASVGIDRMEEILTRAAAGAVPPTNTPVAGNAEVRRLQAGDVEEAARLHRASFPGFFLSSLGERFLREFYRGFLSDETAVTAVARDTSGRLQGVAVGTTEPSGFFSRLLRRRFLGFALASALAVVRRPSALARLVRGVAYRGGGVGEGALLSSICVAPGDQGAGTGARLMIAWTAEAVRLGATAAHLTTDAVDNDLVRGFYARQGWRETEEFVSAEGRPMIVYSTALGGVARSQSADTSR